MKRKSFLVICISVILTSCVKNTLENTKTKVNTHEAQENIRQEVERDYSDIIQANTIEDTYGHDDHEWHDH